MALQLNISDQAIEENSYNKSYLIRLLNQILHTLKYKPLLIVE